MERWRWVVGYEGQYKISSLGKVKSVDRHVKMESAAWGKTGVRFHPGKTLKQTLDKRGYLVVTLSQSGAKMRTARVHREVLKAFVGPKPYAEWDCCHNDGNRANNRLDNLRYDTKSNNQLDRREHGTAEYNQGEDSVTAVLTEKEVLAIRRLRRSISNGQLAELYGVHPSTICDITHFRTWKHI